MALIYEDESFKIRGAAFDVYKKLGYVHKEKVYQGALEIALTKRNLKVEPQRKLPVFFENYVTTHLPCIFRASFRVFPNNIQWHKLSTT